MAAHQAQRMVEQSRSPLAHILMRGAMEAIAGHAGLAPRRGHAILASVIGHRAVEFGLKRGHQRRSRHGFAEGADAGEIDRVVSRRGGQEFFQRGDHAVVDAESPPIAGAGVHCFERHCVDSNRAGLNLSDGVAVIAHTLQTAFGQRLLTRHLQNLILH